MTEFISVETSLLYTLTLQSELSDKVSAEIDNWSDSIEIVKTLPPTIS